MSPTLKASVRFQMRITSPRWNAGAIDSESTTIPGCDVFDNTDTSFHSMYGVDSKYRNGSSLAQRPLVKSIISYRGHGGRLEVVFRYGKSELGDKNKNTKMIERGSCLFSPLLRGFFFLFFFPQVGTT
jgi:hypothetical protein